MGPALTFGGAAGIGPSGNAGDNMTANFGVKAFRNPAPTGYLNFARVSPFGPPLVAIRLDGFQLRFQPRSMAMPRLSR